MPVLPGTQYATRTDLASLGLIGGVLSSIPTGTQDAALQAASSIADSYLQSEFVLPITQWGLDLTRIVCIIAAYDLLTSKGYNPATGADPNIRQRYLDALSWLDDVSKGTQTPASIVDSSTSPSQGDGAVASGFDSGSLSTTAVRGWTDRGIGTPPQGTSGSSGSL